MLSIVDDNEKPLSYCSGVFLLRFGTVGYAVGQLPTIHRRLTIC